MIHSRLSACSVLGIVLLLATGCAGKTGTVESQGMTVVAPVENQASAPVPLSSQDAVPSDEPFDPFSKADEGAGEEYDPWESFNTNIFEFN
ncbi:MAG: hypothetical protein OEV08_06520, partial [Nitrospira sp.]|nr:hypothetical protein [Nitrospira sp.]